MENVNFFALSRTLQERIVGGIEGRFPPMPMLSRRARIDVPTKWIGLSVISLVLLLVVHRIGYGDLESALARHSIALLPAYIGLGSAMVFGILASLGVYVRAARLPYPRGVYVYASRVLDARSHPLRSLPIQELQSIRQQGLDVALTFPGETLLVSAVDATNAASAVAELESTRAREAPPESVADALSLIDPLYQPRFSNPVGESEALKYELPLWVRLHWLFAVVLGSLLGAGIFMARNAGSDAKLFRNAEARNSAAAYQRYLVSGRSHLTEVKTVRLPLAQLADAAQVGTVEALLDFEAQHPDAAIQTQIAAAKRKAYLAELEKAKQPRTLAALFAFRERYPNHGLTSELQGALHELYLDAQSKVGARKLAPEPGAFMTKLITVLEASGPRVELRFRRRDGASMSHVDKDLAKVAEYMGEISHPTRYFDPAHTSIRHKAIADDVQAAFVAAYPKELMALTVGEPVTDPKVLPPVMVPTLFITTMEDWSGHTYLFKKPRGAFIGVFFNFDIEFVMPKDQVSYRTKWVVFRPVATTQIKELEDAPRTNPPIEEAIYENMAQEARKQFLSKLTKTLLGEGGK